MISTGLLVADADGLHEDGWCWPNVRLRLKASGSATELRLGIWLKPETTGARRTVFTVSSDVGPTTVQIVALGEGAEIALPLTSDAGQDFNVRINTPHRASTGEDKRELSFILTSLTMA